MDELHPISPQPAQMAQDDGESLPTLRTVDGKDKLQMREPGEAHASEVVQPGTDVEKNGVRSDLFTDALNEPQQQVPHRVLWFDEPLHVDAPQFFDIIHIHASRRKNSQGSGTCYKRRDDVEP